MNLDDPSPALRPPFEQVAAALTGPLRRYLERYVGQRALAEDLCQETLIRMARGWAGFDGRAAPRTWAFAIASRVAADHFRLPERRARIVDLEAALEVPDGAPGHEARLIEDGMNHCIREFIDSLPETYREALILHDLEGLTAEQVAEVGACSLATAKIRIHRARKRLREVLSAGCSFAHDADGAYRCDRR